MSTALANHGYFFVFAAVCVIAFGAQAWGLRQLGPARALWMVGALAAAFLAAGWHFMGRAEARETREIQGLTRDFARLFASDMEVLGHWRLSGEVNPQDPHYLELIALQKRWLALSPAVHDIYTMRKRSDGRYAFVVDSETDYDRDGKFEGDREERTTPGEIYPEVDAAMEQAFQGETGFNFEPLTDRWGTWVSAYVPLSAPDGRVEALLGVDFEAETFRQRVTGAEWRVIGLTMVAELLLLGASTLVFVTRAGAHERQKAQGALRESEEKLRQIFEHASQFFYSHTVDGRITYLSPQAKDFLDCPPEDAMRPWTDFLTDNPANAEGIRLTDKAIETGQAQRPYELELRSMKGRIVWAEVNESPVVVDGKTVAIVGAVSNITERKEVEARKRAETERYYRQRDALIALNSKGGNGDDWIAAIRKLTETSAKTLGVARVSVWRYNADRTCLQCVDLYELEADRHSAGIELGAEAYPIYFRALENLDVIAAEDACRDARTAEFAGNYLRPLGITSMLDAPIHLEEAGEGVLCHEHTGPVRRWTADEETFAVAVANRVSLALEGWERRQAEEKLRSAHVQLRQMVTHSPALIYRLKVGNDGHVPVAVSANVTRVLGYDVEEVLHAGWWAAHLHPEDRERAFASDSETMRKGFGRSEYRVRHKDGGYRWIEDSCRVTLDASGQPQEVVGVWMDVTERQEAEAARDQLAAILEATTDLVGITDVAGHLRYLNRAGRALLGLGPDEDITHTSITDSLGSAEQHRTITEALAAVRQGTWSGEGLLLNGRGEEIPVSQVFLSHKAAGDGTEVISMIMRDITASKRTEQTLRESANRARLQTAALEAAANSVVITDERGTILWVNAAFTALTGYSADEVVGRNPRVLKSDPQTAGVYKPMWREISQGRVWQGEIVSRRKNGELYHEEMQITPVRVAGEAITHFIAIKQDITARKRGEEELRWKTALLEAQVDAALDGILVVDDFKTQIIKNDRFNTVWQIPRELAERMDDRECLQFATSQTKHPQRFSEKVAYLYDHPDEISRDEIELINGTVLDRYSAPIRNKGGKHYGRIWTFRDVTERKLAEAALQDLHGQLLDASRRSGMAEIASNVLHNVGNVLNSVNVSVAVATAKVRDFKVATLERVAATLKAQPDLAAFLTKDPRGAEVPAFLGRLAACLESDRGALLEELDSLRKHIEHINEIVTVQQRYTRACGVTEVLSLPDLLEDAIRLNADAIENHGLHVMRDFAEVPPAHVDRHKVLQILVNLIRNAKHALDDGAPEKRRLVMGLSWDGRNRVTLTVGDNGIGISPDNLTRIFAQGFTTREGGHGFGLHGSANAAREMGGSLSAKSDGPGRGATFTLELPLKPDSQKR